VFPVFFRGDGVIQKIRAPIDKAWTGWSAELWNG